MKKTTLYILLSILVSFFFFERPARAVQFTEIGDTLSGILTAKKSPYLITSTIIVPSNKQLAIQPGVVLTFTSNTKMQINGHLECLGEEKKTIRMTAEQSVAAPGGWEGIFFTNIRSKGIFQHCIIEYSTSGIYCELASNITIDHCIFDNNQLYAIYCIGYSSPTISNNIISNSNYGIVSYDYSSPKITGNTISKTKLAGIYCFNSSNPSIEENIITQNTGIGVLCRDMSMPIIENNLIIKNLNGIKCKNSSPFIMFNSICYNDYYGIACMNSSAQIMHNNVFENTLYNIDIFEPDVVHLQNNWWGLDAYTTMPNADNKPHVSVSPDKLNGPVSLTNPSFAPITIPTGAPQSIYHINLHISPNEGRNDLAHVGDLLTITITGEDGSSTTRDNIPIIMQHKTIPTHKLTTIARETGKNTGIYIGSIKLEKQAAAFVRTQGWQTSEHFKIYSPPFFQKTISLHLVNRRPEITSFVIKGAHGRLKTTANNPVTFTWTYPTYDDEKMLDRPVKLEIATEETFDRSTRILLQEFSATATHYTCEKNLLKPGEHYFARLRMRDFDSWRTNKTIIVHINLPPTAPDPIYPQPNIVITNGIWVTPAIKPATDPDNDRLIYQFEIYTDSTKGILVEKGTGKFKEYHVEWAAKRHLEENESYWWRACTNDGYDRVWTPLHRFSISIVDEPISPFSLTHPSPNALIASGNVTFHWEHALDPDPDEQITYTFWLSSTPTFDDKIAIADLVSNRYKLDKTLKKNTTYYWKVLATNKNKATQWCNTTMEPYGEFQIGTPR